MRREEEIELVRKAKAGDTAAFAEMIRRYQNLVYATAFQILKDTALAEDAAQEAFVAAFRSLPDLRTESSFPPWLRKIVRNLALASRKEQRRFGALEEAGVLQSPRRMPDRRPRGSGAKPTRSGKRWDGSYPRCPLRSGFPCCSATSTISRRGTPPGSSASPRER